MEHRDSTIAATPIPEGILEALRCVDAAFAQAQSQEELDALKQRVFQEVECRWYARSMDLDSDPS